MGCHTWFYIPIEFEITEKEVLDQYRKTAEWSYTLAVKELKLRGVNFVYDTEVYDELAISNKHVERLRYTWTDSSIDDIKEHMKVHLDSYYSLDTPEGIQDAYNSYEFDDGIIRYYNGKFYEHTKDSPYDLFRVGNYPEIVLTSYVDAIEYIKSLDDKVIVYDFTYEKLQEFFNTYPEGIIDFG